MTLGPLEYTVIGFRKGTFDGSIAREIGKVVDQNVIRIVDIVMIACSRRRTSRRSPRRCRPRPRPWPSSSSTAGPRTSRTPSPTPAASSSHVQ